MLYGWGYNKASADISVVCFPRGSWKEVNMVYETADPNSWELHLRIAQRGDRLSPEDRAVYDATRRELDDNEALGAIQNAKQAREELHNLEAQRHRLEQHRRETRR